jgi:hypothetical protein
LRLCGNCLFLVSRERRQLLRLPARGKAEKRRLTLQMLMNFET